VSAHFTDVWEAYHFLLGHAVRGSNGSSFLDVLDIFVTKVNPATDSVDDDESANTAIRVWLESGPGTEEVHDLEKPDLVGHVHLHDPDLDVGGATFEEALIKLAEKVRAHYGTASEEDRLGPPKPLSPELAAFFAKLEARAGRTSRL
jgi:hypothetical protein